MLFGNTAEIIGQKTVEQGYELVILLMSQRELLGGVGPTIAKDLIFLIKR